MKNGKISEKDRRARLRQHLTSNKHANLRLQPEKLKQALENLIIVDWSYSKAT